MRGVAVKSIRAISQRNREGVGKTEGLQVRLAFVLAPGTRNGRVKGEKGPAPPCHGTDDLRGRKTRFLSILVDLVEEMLRNVT